MASPDPVGDQAKTSKIHMLMSINSILLYPLAQSIWLSEWCKRTPQEWEELEIILLMWWRLK